MSNPDDLDNGMSDDDPHRWNRREHRKPMTWYVLLVIICSGIAWILSSMGYE